MNQSMLEDRRVWIGGGALVALLLVAASWMFLIGPKFDSASSLQSQNDDAQTSNQLVKANNDKLAKQARDIGSLQDRLRTALAGLPGDNDFAGFTREVTSLATQNGVTLSNVTISAPTAQTPAAAPAEGGTSESASPAPTAPAATQANAAGSVSTIAVTLSSSGSGPRQARFLKSLQNGSRRLLVTSSQLSVGGNSRVNSIDAATTMTTQLTIFTAPMSVEQLKSIQSDLEAK